jgi:DNA primase
MTIVELAEKYNLELTKQGNLFITYCPFHRDEHRPNFTIYEETDSYFCYTCSKGGNAADFYAKMEGITYAQAEYKLYSDLNTLLDKINKIRKEPIYNETVNLQISKIIRGFLYAYPDKLASALTLMQAVDTRLLRDINQDEAIALVGEVNSRLNSITQIV